MTDSTSHAFEADTELMSHTKSPMALHGSPMLSGSTAQTRQLSRDEMNLAEFPLTVLSTRTNSNLKTLEFKDTIKGKNGEVVNRQWIITGADKFGLPTSSDDEVLLGLLKLTVDAGINDRKIFFTRYELLKILRWSTEGRSYLRLQKALDRLSGVRIKTVNGFYDNDSKLHSTRNFGIIDGYEINDGRGVNVEVKPSFFTWSETIFKSFQVGFIKKLDLDFLLDLESAISKRLYRYLDKHFWYKSKVQINLFTLAHEKIGISRNLSYASQLKQHLDPAIEELVRHKFLLGAEYVGTKDETEVIFYAASGARRASQQTASGAVPPTVMKAVLPISPDETERGAIIAALEARGIKGAQAERLLDGKNEKLLKKIAQIIVYFDELIATQSTKITRSPVGFLYRAVENAERFVLPTTSQQQMAFTTASAPQRHRENVTRVNVSRRAEEGAAASDEETLYLTERKRELMQLRSEIEPAMLAKIRNDVEGALARLKGHITEERFKDAVEHGVDQQLIKMFALPTRAEWSKRRRERVAQS